MLAPAARGVSPSKDAQPGPKTGERWWKPDILGIGMHL